MHLEADACALFFYLLFFFFLTINLDIFLIEINLLNTARRF